MIPVLFGFRFHSITPLEQNRQLRSYSVTVTNFSRARAAAIWAARVSCGVLGPPLTAETSGVTRREPTTFRVSDFSSLRPSVSASWTTLPVFESTMVVTKEQVETVLGPRLTQMDRVWKLTVVATT